MEGTVKSICPTGSVTLGGALRALSVLRITRQSKFCMCGLNVVAAVLILFSRLCSNRQGSPHLEMKRG